MLLLRPQYDINVVIPTSDDNDRLELALMGYAAQTDKNFELHVVNDGGTAAIEATINKFRDRLHIYYHYLNEPGQYHPASARNLGIEHCTRGRIILSDCDVIPNPLVVQEHRQYGDDKVYVLGMRRRISRAIAEQIIIPRQRYRQFSALDIEKYPWIGDQRLIDPMFHSIFKYMIKDKEPTPEQLDQFARCSGCSQMQLSHDLWKAWFCWSFNVSFYGSNRRFNTDFDGSYGYEDLEFGLRMVADGYKILINPRIVVYHLDHLPRAVENKNQRGIFFNTLKQILDNKCDDLIPG